MAAGGGGSKEGSKSSEEGSSVGGGGATITRVCVFVLMEPSTRAVGCGAESPSSWTRRTHWNGILSLVRRFLTCMMRCSAGVVLRDRICGALGEVVRKRD